jgi:hypothetical protein
MEDEYPVEHRVGKSPLNYKEMHTAGVGTDPRATSAFVGANQGQEELAAALERRFAQPNLFKISAALAKPQLGGFAASWGSAMEELGKQEEASRAVAPTVARMRAEVAAGQLPLAQNLSQQEAFKKFQANPTPEAGIEVLNWSKDSPAAKAVLEYFPQLHTIAGTRSTNVNTAITGQRAVAENPYLVLNDPIFKGTVAEVKPDQLANYEKKLNDAAPKDIDPAVWASMGIAEKQAAIGQYSTKQVLSGLDEEKKSEFLARNADNLLNDLTYLRTLAVDPKLAPMFSMFKNGDAVGMLRAFLDKNPGNTQAAVEGLTAAAMEQLKNADEATRAKADKLIKGIARMEINLRSSSVNPTNAFQELNTNQSPSLQNSQAGFIGILDQMGLQAKHDIDRHDLRVESNIPARKMLTGPEARTLENRLREEQIALAKSNPMDFSVVPSWYKPAASAAAVKNKEKSQKAVSNTPATATNIPTSNSALVDALRAAQASQTGGR